MNLDQGSQVIDILGFARRRGKLVAIVAGTFLLVTYWVAMALPNLYSSSATILVEPQSVDEQLVESGVRDTELNERLGLMTADILSRTRLSKIIDDFKHANLATTQVYTHVTTERLKKAYDEAHPRA